MLGDDDVALADGLRAPGQARAWFAERAAGLAPTLTDNAQLVISELVTNAVRHGGTSIRLRVRAVEGGIRVEVFDSGARLPAEPEGRPALDRPSGRGLLIVGVTADAWGVSPEPAGAGKTIWADLLG